MNLEWGGILIRGLIPIMLHKCKFFMKISITSVLPQNGEKSEENQRSIQFDCDFIVPQSTQLKKKFIKKKK